MAHSKLNKIATTLIILSAIVFLGGFIAHFWVKKTVLDYLTEEIPEEMSVDFKNLYVNVFRGVVSLEDVQIHIRSNNNEDVQTMISFNKGLIHVNPLQFIRGKEQIIKNLTLEHPVVQHYLNPLDSIDSTSSNLPLKLEKPLTIQQLSILEGEVKVYNPQKDHPVFSINSFTLNLTQLTTNTSLLSRKIPFTYEDYQLQFTNFNAALNQYENLMIEHFEATTAQWTFQNLGLNPVFKELELSKHLQVERDHISLLVPKMQWTNPHFNDQESKLQVHIDTISINSPTLAVFRDKLIADDSRTKPLYGESIRNLPFNLTIPRITVHEGNISYKERIDPAIKMEEIKFQEIEATIHHLGNAFNDSTKTWVTTNSMVMNKIPMELNWDFNSQDRANQFNASGSFRNLHMQDINAYLKANLRAEGKGTVDEMYFSIYGNDVQSQGEIKMKYEDLEFKILKKNHKGVNKILTAIGDLFVKNNSTEGDDPYRYANIEAERDVTKSFFNYLWLNIQDGLLNTLTGNGKRK